MIRENIPLSSLENGEVGGSEVWMLRGSGPTLVEERQYPGNSELPLREGESAPLVPNLHLRAGMWIRKIQEPCRASGGG